MSNNETTPGSASAHTPPHDCGFVGPLLDVLAESGDMNELLDEVVQLATEGIPDVETASITMHSSDGRPCTVAASDSRARFFDDVQYRSGSGPCLDAAVTGVPHYVSAITDLLDPQLREAARDFQVDAVLSVPVITATAIVGSLNLYLAAGPSEWPESSLEMAELLADYSDAALSVAQRLHNSRLLIEAYQAEIVNRQIIEQAVGMTMARRRCDADTAHRWIEGLARDGEITLKAAATCVISELAASRTQFRRLDEQSASSGAGPWKVRGDHGIRASELSDQALHRELQHFHDTRHHVVTRRSESALRAHTDRMVELEGEFLRRFPLTSAPDASHASGRDLGRQQVLGHDVTEEG